MYIYEKGVGLSKVEDKPNDSVQIDVISDLHLDFYLEELTHSEIEKFISSFRENMKHKSDEVIIVGGDISHNNNVSEEFLLQLSYIWKNVLIIPGNHDWYLQDKYNDDRYSDLVSRLKDKENINFLMDDVEIFEYKGIKIAGTIMFYNLRELADYAMWKSVMVDSRFLTREFIHSRNRRDVDYYNRVIDEVDIFVSHVPIVNLDGKSTTENLFLNMDVTPKKNVLYLSGHTHYPKNSVDLKHEFDAINVSYGYPSEIKDGRNIATSIFMKEGK